MAGGARGAWPALIGHAHDLVDLVKSGTAVGDEQDSAACRGGEQVRGQLVGGLLVEVLGRLVEYEDGKVSEQHPREGKPLALPSGQSHAVLADICVRP